MSNIYIGQVIEHAQSFMNISDIIKSEAGAALIAIEKALEKGYNKEEILEEWNIVFDSEECKFKSYEEVIDYLETVGI